MSTDLKKLETLVGRLELITQRQEAFHSQKPGLAPKPAVSNNSSGDSGSAPPPTIKAYDDNVLNAVKGFLDASKKIGGEVAQMADKVATAFDLHRTFIWQASGQPEPDQATQQKLLAPIVHQMGEITAFKDTKKGTKVFNHLAAIAEGLPALGWVTVKPTPGPYAKEMADVSMFYVNRVRTEHKGDPVHADWAKAWCEVFSALQIYIKQCHTTGLVWNSAPGSRPVLNTPKKGGSPAPPIGGPPPPPPPPPADLMADLAKGGSTADKDGRQALFAALNKGEGITSGLKKVTADMQTHKNPNLRVQSTVPADAKESTGKTNGKAQQKAGVIGNRTPKLELKDQKVWQIEYHQGNRDIKVQTDMKQSVYIFRCENSVVQIKGKVNSVTVDSCKKTSVVFDSLLSQVEVINCQSVEIQTLGPLPTISIQKTDGCQVYLSKEALSAEIVTSKSSEMNILVPKGEQGDFSEFPVPEQFKTTYDAKKNKLQTVVSDIV